MALMALASCLLPRRDCNNDFMGNGASMAMVAAWDAFGTKAGDCGKGLGTHTNRLLQALDEFQSLVQAGFQQRVLFQSLLQRGGRFILVPEALQPLGIGCRPGILSRIPDLGIGSLSLPSAIVWVWVHDARCLGRKLNRRCESKKIESGGEVP